MFRPEAEVTWYLLLVSLGLSSLMTDAAPHLADIDTLAFLADEGFIVSEQKPGLPLLQRHERDVGSGMLSSGSGSGSGQSITDFQGHDDVTETVLPLRIRSLRVTSSVTARYAKTMVSSHVFNPNNRSQEVNFKMELPMEAFISDFLIETEGQVFRSRVEEKEKAQKAYNTAKKQGKTAGQVKQTSAKKNNFAISINVAAGGTLSFNMTYEELLKRKHGFFQNAITVSPGQIVDHLSVIVHINEPQGLDSDKIQYYVDSRESKTGNPGGVERPQWAEMTQLLRTRATVMFQPSKEDQQTLSMGGKFVVKYDVIHEQNAGRIEIVNGYFVHHFSPEGFKPTRKRVVFVLDTSGSMYGRKIRQTKEAMGTILADLRSKDEFGIVTFESRTASWQPSLVPASRANVQSAQVFVETLLARGGTNLHGGIIDAIAMLDEAERNEVSAVGTLSLIIMLTDGEPTFGITSTSAIKTDIHEKLDGRFSLFSLGFGNGVDYPFLEQLSLQNRGLARKIYEDSDAGLQLVGFFDEVATPLLLNVQISYQDNMIVTNSISETEFPTYFQGTELVVAGQLAVDGNLPDVLVCVVTAETQNAQIQLEMEVNIKEESDAVLSPHAVDDFAQRLWAFLTIKELLRKRAAADGNDEKAALSQRALELSLKYHFVTPLTSLVVVKPDDEQVTSDEPQADAKPNLNPTYHAAPPGPVGGTFRTHTPPRRSMGPIPPVLRSSVDSDPHFMVHSSRGNVTVCFDIMGKPGDVFSLIQDPGAGIWINGHVANAQPHRAASSDGPARTIFDRLTMTFNGQRVLVTSKSIDIGQELSMTWNANWTMVVGDAGLTMSVWHGKYLVIWPREGVSLLVLRHDVERHHVDKTDYFGLYIENGEGFSHKVHGLIGQFQRRKIQLQRAPASIDGDVTTASIRVRGRHTQVVQSERRNHLTGEYDRCWHASNNAYGIIDGSYTDYLVEE